jgi:hypothetical protein
MKLLDYEVVLGTAISNGPIPTVDEAYDPKSLEHIIAELIQEAAMIIEMDAFDAVLRNTM